MSGCSTKKADMTGLTHLGQGKNAAGEDKPTAVMVADQDDAQKEEQLGAAFEQQHQKRREGSRRRV